MPSLLRRAISKVQNKVSNQYQQVQKQRQERQTIDRQAREVQELHRLDSYKKEKLRIAKDKGRQLGKRDAQGISGIVGVIQSFSTGSSKIMQSGNFDYDFTGTGGGKITNFMDNNPFSTATGRKSNAKKSKRSGVTINLQGVNVQGKKNKKRKKSSNSYTDNPLGIW